jgi:cytochrome o ubiquinol oxidase subunit 1
MVVQMVVSYRNREALRDTTGDPWNGRTLEWSTSSPPPDYNFAFTPQVHELDAWDDMKKNGYQRPLSGYLPIHMPKNTAAGFIIAGLSAALGFALIWHMVLPAIGAAAALLAMIVFHTFNYHREYFISAAEVVRTEAIRTRLLESAL